LLISTLLGGCQTAKGPEGQALEAQVPANYRAQVAAYLRKTLKDPYTVRDAEISAPTTIFVGLVNGGSAPGVCLKMNSKNSFGAYTGLQIHAVAMRNGEVTGMGEPLFDTCRNVTWSPFPEIMEQSSQVGRN
jgi:hypothetical protein